MQSDRSSSASTSVDPCDLDGDHTILEIDLLPMDERRRSLMKTTMIVRCDFRTLFGLSLTEQWGHFVERDMGALIHRFSDWVRYPSGDQELQGHTMQVNAACLSCDGRYLYTASDDESIIQWDMLRMEMTDQWFIHEDNVFCLAYHSQRLVSGSFDTVIQVWHCQRRELIHSLTDHSGSVNSVAFNKHGTLIVSTSNDNSLRVWCADTGCCLFIGKEHSNWVRSAGFITDTLIISGAYDRCLKMWELRLEKKEERRNIAAQKSVVFEESITEGVLNIVECIAINCDASLIAAFYGDGFTLYEWPKMTVRNEVVMCSYRGRFHPSIPHIIAVDDSPDALGLIMEEEEHSDDNNTVQLMDVHKCECNTIRNLKVNQGKLKDVCFTPDGYRLITVGLSQTVKVWDTSDLILF